MEIQTGGVRAQERALAKSLDEFVRPPNVRGAMVSAIARFITRRKELPGGSECTTRRSVGV